jgi:hypothetical protein
MTALSIQPPFPIFTDTDGSPLENGYIWLGTANQDPQANPITAYWDAALTITAAQPIRTSGGYPSRSGTPARLYVASDYSIRVQNKNGSHDLLGARRRNGSLLCGADLVLAGRQRCCGAHGAEQDAGCGVGKGLRGCGGWGCG